MHHLTGLVFLLSLLPFTLSLPSLSTTPRVGQSNLYNTYQGKAPPYPASHPSPILATAPNAAAGPDDLLFQNLLAAEWVIYSFYQAGVTTFNETSFTSLGLSNTTYSSIASIRDNEAGHLHAFQDSISSASLKPGACKYDYGINPVKPDPMAYLAMQTLIEIASMAFLTGLTQQAKLNVTKGALTAIAATETRHESWALMGVWGLQNPFGGPADTSYPYANQILDSTNQFVVPGSCPHENPVFPSPRQGLPQMAPGNKTRSLKSGSEVVFTFTKGTGELSKPEFEEGKKYWTVFVHSLFNISVPYDVQKSTARIPKEIEEMGIVITVIADCEGAPTEESVLAGPMFTLYQPEALTLQI